MQHQIPGCKYESCFLALFLFFAFVFVLSPYLTLSLCSIYVGLFLSVVCVWRGHIWYNSVSYMYIKFHWENRSIPAYFIHLLYPSQVYPKLDIWQVQIVPYHFFIFIYFSTQIKLLQASICQTWRDPLTTMLYAMILHSEDQTRPGEIKSPGNYGNPCGHQPRTSANTKDWWLCYQL